MILRAEAFAKTNLELAVLGRREDGFHELDTIFQTIDVTDTVEVAAGGSEIVVECSDPSVPSDARNIVHRAAVALRDRAGTALGARIRLEKRIPVGGGLGGGSADAAVGMVLLSRLWNLAFGEEVLSEIGASLGSDVPFFFSGGTARGRGRGERIEPLPDRAPMPLLLIVPPFSLSTAAVYSRWRPPLVEAMSVPLKTFGKNELASAVLDLEPEMMRYWETVSRYYPDCQISGSGSSLVARDHDRGEDRLSAMRRDLPDARVLRTRSVARGEYRDRTTIGSRRTEGNAG